MKHNREQVLSWIGLSEGGYVNNPNDNGGPTNKGITQKTYSAWRKKHGRPPNHVINITKDEADTIVFEEYMRPARFDDLFDGLDYAVADMAVNSGVSRAAKNLQQALGFTGRNVDGIIGAQTLAALPNTVQARADLLDRYADLRLKYVMGLSDWKHFGKGWKRRYEGVEIGTQHKDIGVRDRAYLLLKNSVSAENSLPPLPIPEPKPVGPIKAAPPAQGGSWAGFMRWLRDLFAVV